MAPSKAMVKRDLLKTKEYVSQIKSLIEASDHPAPSTLERWFEKLTTLLQDFEALRDSISDVLFDDDHQDQTEYTQLFKPDVDSLSTDLNTLLQKVEANLFTHRKAQSPVPSLSSSQGSNGTSVQPQIRLPYLINKERNVKWLFSGRFLTIQERKNLC
uniref:Uncharacterized protein n=1 Tax=Cacopsylla melanoneura TaxID=428564 RepID=A0A8D9AI29_9HEMI